jgi:hypothetical protein
MELSWANGTGTEWQSQAEQWCKFTAVEIVKSALRQSQQLILSLVASAKGRGVHVGHQKTYFRSGSQMMRRCDRTIRKAVNSLGISSQKQTIYNSSKIYFNKSPNKRYCMSSSEQANYKLQKGTSYSRTPLDMPIARTFHCIYTYAVPVIIPREKLRDVFRMPPIRCKQLFILNSNKATCIAILSSIVVLPVSGRSDRSTSRLHSEAPLNTENPCHHMTFDTLKLLIVPPTNIKIDASHSTWRNEDRKDIYYENSNSR